MNFSFTILILSKIVLGDLALFNRLSNGLQGRITSKQSLKNSDLTGPAAIEVQILSNLLLKNRLDTSTVFGKFGKYFKNRRGSPRYRNYKQTMMKRLLD